MKAAIDTVFFDWGGVIADDPGDGFLKLLLKDLGASDMQVEEIYEKYMFSFMKGEISENQYWEVLRQKYGLTVHDTISHEFKKWDGLVKNDSILALVEKIKHQGIKVAVFSNVIEPTYNVLEQAGDYAGFDAVIASCKVGTAKPEKQIYELALQKLNTTAEQSLFIDDKQKNLDPADETGFHTILAQNSEQIIKDVERYLTS